MSSSSVSSTSEIETEQITEETQTGRVLRSSGVQGVEVSVMLKKLFNAICQESGTPTRIERTPLFIKSASENSMNNISCFNFNVHISNNIKMQRAIHVIKNLNVDLILGADFVQEEHVRIDGSNRTISFRQNESEIYNWGDSFLYARTNSILAPMSYTVVPVITH